MSLSDGWVWIVAVYLAAFAGVVLAVLLIFAAINRFADFGESRGWWTRRRY